MHTLLLRYSYALAMISVMFQCTYRDLADVPKYEFTCIHSQGATMIWAVSICTYQKLGEVFRPLPRFVWSSYALTKRWLMFPMPCVNYQDLREVRVHLQGSGIRCYAPARIWVMASYTCQDLGDAGMHLPEWMWVMTSCTYQTVGDGAMHLPGFGWRRHALPGFGWRCHAPTRDWVTLSCTYQGLGDVVMHVPGFGWRCHAPTRVWVTPSCTYQTVGDVALFINVGGHDEGGILLSVLVQADDLQTNREWRL